MKDIELSLRMKTVADMVVPGSRVCDIGCDHAFVSIYLALHKAEHVIASDVRTGPCDIAEANIAKWGVKDTVELRLGDGLDTIEAGEVDTIIMAGMGGLLMLDILARGRTVVSTVRHLVLQPQSEVSHVRRYIAENGWRISDEAMVKDAGKYYVVIGVDCETAGDRNIADIDEVYYRYGRMLIENRSEVLREYLEDKSSSLRGIAKRLEEAGTETAMLRLDELRTELDCIERAKMLMMR